MSESCARCGVGRRARGGVCDWCAAPSRARLPFWVIGRRRLLRSHGAAALGQRGAIVTGVAAGVVVHLLAAAVGVTFGIPAVWQAGFFWSQQWWWALVPEFAQPWLFAGVRGAAYGVLAGWAATRTRGNKVAECRDRAAWLSPRFVLSPAVFTALAAFVVSMSEVLLGWNSEVGVQYSLIAAALGWAVGRLTTLITRGYSRSG